MRIHRGPGLANSLAWRPEATKMHHRPDQQAILNSEIKSLPWTDPSLSLTCVSKSCQFKLSNVLNISRAIICAHALIVCTQRAAFQRTNIVPWTDTYTQMYCMCSAVQSWCSDLSILFLQVKKSLPVDYFPWICHLCPLDHISTANLICQRFTNSSTSLRWDCGFQQVRLLAYFLLT